LFVKRDNNGDYVDETRKRVFSRLVKHVRLRIFSTTISKRLQINRKNCEAIVELVPTAIEKGGREKLKENRLISPHG
jgi:hypothetical protein